MDAPSTLLSWVDKRILAAEWLKDDVGFRLHFCDGTSSLTMVRCEMGNPFRVELWVSGAERDGGDILPDVVIVE